MFILLVAFVSEKGKIGAFWKLIEVLCCALK